MSVWALLSKFEYSKAETLTKFVSEMESTDSLICNQPLESGELYLFHSEDPLCPPESSLWGVFDHVEKDGVMLESYSLDLRSFGLWGVLPKSCHYCRLATRGELRDYTYNIALYESAKRAGVGR